MTSHLRILLDACRIVPRIALVASLLLGCSAHRTAGRAPLASLSRVWHSPIHGAFPSVASEPVSSADPELVASSRPIPIRQPCARLCGCRCVPNAQCFGYFSTQWRSWPCGPSLPAASLPERAYEPSQPSLGAPPMPAPSPEEIAPQPEKEPAARQPEKEPAAAADTPAEPPEAPILPPGALQPDHPVPSESPDTPPVSVAPEP